MDDRHDMQEKRLSFMTTKYKVINIKIKIKKYEIVKKKSKNCKKKMSVCSCFYFKPTVHYSHILR